MAVATHTCKLWLAPEQGSNGLQNAIPPGLAAACRKAAAEQRKQTESRPGWGWLCCLCLEQQPCPAPPIEIAVQADSAGAWSRGLVGGAADAAARLHTTCGTRQR
eukprot:711136-Pelagomonas_calceolata.AAC.4